MSSRAKKECMMSSGGSLKDKWIQNAVKPENRGLLHKKLGVPKGEKIPMQKINKATHSKSATLRKEANLAKTLRNINK